MGVRYTLGEKMKKIFQDLKNNALFKGVFFMGAGTVIAQMINVFIQPVLTRIVTPEVLGIYTYIISLANIIIPIATLKLELLIVSEPKDEKAQYITDACVWVCTIISIIYFIVILIGLVINTYNIFNKFGFVTLIVPAIVFTNGMRFLFISYNNRYKKYKLITIVAILREASRAIIQIVSGLLSFGVLGQALGYALSPLLGLNVQMKEYIEKKRDRKAISAKQFVDIVFKYGRRQILYLVPAQFINSFSSSLVTIAITSLFSASVLGYYSAGIRVLDIPIIFITANVSKVIYQHVCESIKNKKPVLRTIFTVIIVLFVIGMIGFGILFIFAPEVTRFVFGKGYEVAGEYLRCMCVMYIARLVATSFSGLYTAFGKQNIELFLNIALVCVAALAYYVSKMYTFEVTTFLWFVSIGYASIYVIMLIGYVCLCFRYDKSIC